MKAKILSKIVLSAQIDQKNIANDFVKNIYDQLETLLSTKIGNMPNSYQNVAKHIEKIKKHLPTLIDECINISIDDLESDTIDIDLLKKMPNEIDSIKVGDKVLAVVSEPCYNQKNIPTKRYILEFDVLSFDSFLSEKGRMGITAHESPFGGMIELKWCDLVVKKESYEAEYIFQK